MSIVVWIIFWMVSRMIELGIEAIISIVLMVLSLIASFISHYFYVRGKLHKAATGAITNAEQDDKTGEEKLDIAVEQVYGLIPISLKPFIHRKSVRKIVQAAFDKIEDYAKKQVEKKSKKKEDSSDENSDMNEVRSETTVTMQAQDNLNSDVLSETKGTMSMECSIKNNSLSRRNIMENNQTNNVENIDELNDVVELRTANSKHFRNANGSYSAIIFDSPVHYLDEADNTYKEIDMSLETDNSQMIDGYKVKSNKFGVKFAKALSSPSLMVLEDKTGKIDISCGGYANGVMRLMSNAGVVAKIDYADKKISKLKKLLSQTSAAASSTTMVVNPFNVVDKVKSVIEQRLEKCKKLASKIMYENAFVGADLEYVISSNKVKENIIVGSRADKYEYAFTIKLDGFDMQLATDGSGINIISKADNTLKYIIPAPFMYDANEKRSDSVMLRLNKVSEGVFGLEIIADKTWINSAERTFPVVIDPQIISTETSDIIMNTYNNGVLVPSEDDLNALGRCYGTLYDMKVEIKTPNIVSKVFSNDTRVLNATIELTKAEDIRKASSQGFNVYDGDRVVDHFTYNGSNNRVDINITNELNAAIKGKIENTVFDIKAVDRTSTDNDYMILLNSKSNVADYRPKIMIDYVSDRLSLGASYHTSDVKRAGVGEVNLFNGNLTFTHTDLPAAGNKLPFDLKHIYMSKLKGKEYDCELFGNEERRLTPDFQMGKGWKMNIQQYLIKDEKEPTKATYLDGNGEVQLFEEKYFYEVNGIRKFVKKEDCKEAFDGSYSIDINENGQQNKYDVTKAMLTESGLLLFCNMNGRLLSVSEDDTPIKNEYYIIYNGYKEIMTPISDGKYRIRRYCRRWTESYYYNNQHKLRDFVQYYASEEVFFDESAGIYKHYGDNYIVTSEEEVCEIEYKDGNAYIHLPEPQWFCNYTGSYQLIYSCSFKVYIEKQYEDGTKDSQIIAFNTDEISSIRSEIEELKYYIKECSEKDKELSDEERVLRDSLSAPNVDISNITDLIKQEQNNYESMCSEYDKIRKEKTASINSKNERLAELNKEYSKNSLDLSKALKDQERAESEVQFWDKWFSTEDYKRFQRISEDVSEYDAKNRQLQESIADISYNLQKESINSERELQRLTDKIEEKKARIEELNKIVTQNDIRERLEKITQNRTILNNRKNELDILVKDKKKQLLILIDLEKLKPIDYIVDNGGNKLGFDYFGRLVEIADNNDNKTTIKYDGDRIESITTSDEQKIRFEYYYDRLNKIIDTRQRMTLFEYNDNGFLSKIVYPDNQSVSLDGAYDNRISEFKYNQYDELEEVRDQSGYAVKYTYNYYKQVETVKEYTYTQEISAENFTQIETPIDGDSVEIRYNNFKSTSVKNNRGVAMTYVFDNAGRAVNIYRDDQFVSQDRLNVTEAINLSYKGRRKSYDVAVSQTPENYVKNHGFENGTSNWIDINDNATTHCSVIGASYVGGSNALKIEGNPQQARYAKQVILASELPIGRNLIFAAWAKAQSAFIRSDRSSGYGDDIFENYNIDSFDDYKRNRKFGIRAVIKYAGYEPETMETTFDWYNTAWQFTSLPIRLLKDRTLESITLYLDYTNNINSVMFDNVQLIEGEGDYKEFYEDGKLRYSTDGKVDTFYPEYYNGMPTHTIQVDESGIKYLSEYVYDENKRLVRSVDHDGIVSEYTYLDSGELLKSESYHKDDPGTKFVSETLYNNKGNKIGDVDPRGKVNGEQLSTKYSYINGTNLLHTLTDTRDSDTVYGYDCDNDNNLSISSDDDGEDNKNLFEYKKGYLTRVYNDCISFEYGYDGFGRSKFIKLDGTDYATYAYQKTEEGGEIGTVTFANSEVFTSQTDKFGNTKNISYSSGTLTSPQIVLSNTFDENNRLTQFTDGLLNEVHTFEYDDKDRIACEQFTRSGVLIKSDLEYDSNDNVTKSSLNLGAEVLNYVYEYSQSVEPKLLSATLPNGTSSNYEYDPLGRKTATVLTDGFGNPIMRQNISYVKYGDHATVMPSAERFGLGGNLSEHTKYKYDKKGNISEIYKNGLLTNRYSYDKLNRMVREDNRAIGQTTVFNYDTNGNILTKSVYAFTLGNLLEKSPVSVTPYSYRATTWRDQMTEFNGEKCECDNIGNPTKYRGHITSFKYGGRLMSFGSNTYTYNANGERVSKTVNGIETRFITASGKVVRSVTNGIVTDFFYDNYGLSGIRHNGVSYFVRKNVLGDVTHIYDQSGNLQAQYVYDAWGNHKVLDATGAEDINLQSIGNINPIRYRGYYYDTETKLYYLKARYYDPEAGRFISADDTQFLEPNTVNGLNMYAYCGSNPVMRVDPTGASWDWGVFWDAVVNVFAAGVALAVEVATTLVAGPVVGTIAGFATFGVINNTVNAIYYNYFSSSKSDLTPTSYSGIDGSETKYLSRWDRLDYAKAQTGQSTYNSIAWRYYNEYGFHMYAWILTGWSYKKGVPGISSIADSALIAQVDSGQWDGRPHIDIFSTILGLLGI